MIYDRGNAAKQWILEELDRRFGQAPARILDLACGDAHIWKLFLESHPSIVMVGIDTDRRAIVSGQKQFVNQPRICLEVFDAQCSRQDEPFDVVVALSAIEHVVNRQAFLKTVRNALKPGGMAFLNYDVGHFRSRRMKERLMVPVSQMLAKVGIEGPYMKRVDDRTFRSQAEAQGFSVLGTHKHNLNALKGFMWRMKEELIVEWFAFENRLNERASSDALDPIMLSTTLVIQKP